MASATTNPGCNGLDLSGPDLNADGDEADEIVHLYDGMAVQNLRCAAADRLAVHEFADPPTSRPLPRSRRSKFYRPK